MQHPDHRAMNEQRHAHQGLDSFVQQNRVEHTGLIDVVQDDRPPLGGDTASETPADRDPDALPDFLLQAAGCGRDQLTPRAVQQQQRHGVGVQDLPHPAQQLGEKVIGVKMRQRRIRNRPDVPERVLRIWWRAQRRCHEERLPPRAPAGTGRDCCQNCCTRVEGQGSLTAFSRTDRTVPDYSVSAGHLAGR
jgi:hypothetical protein